VGDPAQAQKKPAGGGRCDALAAGGLLVIPEPGSTDTRDLSLTLAKGLAQFQ
jgi:hypothetical protein